MMRFTVEEVGKGGTRSVLVDQSKRTEGVDSETGIAQ